MPKNNSYNIDRYFDYTAVRSIVLKSPDKIVKEALRKRAYVSQVAVSDSKDNDYPNNVNVKLLAPSTSPSLKIKIRNTTKYLNWRLSILKRDNFTCRICHTSVKDINDAKRFDDICKDNNLSTVEQALNCKELWNLNNGFSICYRCHKDIENLRRKLRNIFLLSRYVLQ